MEHVCQYCGHLVRRDPDTRTGYRSPTGWWHDSPAWLGLRCPNGAHYAEPVSVLS